MNSWCEISRNFVSTLVGTSPTIVNKGGQTAILVRWSAVQRTTEMIADQRIAKNSGPALVD
jgi:hypothetical protein